jgi:hypothetical protein
MGQEETVACRIVVLLVAFVAVASPQSPSQGISRTTKAKCQLTAEDYSVYAALVEGLGGPEDPEESWNGKQVFVADLTGADRDPQSHWGGWGFRSQSKAAPSHATVLDFQRNAQSSCPLNSELANTKSYRIITKEELEKAFKGAGWEQFYKQYPEAGGYWIFSRPGYNSSRTEALLDVSHWCGGLCGTGHLYFLVKQNGQWKVQNRLILWIS